MCQVAYFVGLSAHRPELNGRGPDVLWGLESTNFAVIECKNEAFTEEISKRSVNQLSGSMNWFKEQYPNGTATPVIIHPSNKLGSGATSYQGTRVITKDCLQRLCANLRDFAKSLNAQTNLDEGRIANLLTKFNLLGSKIIEQHSVSARNN